MRRLFSLLALCLALVLGAAPSFAADVAHGGQIFSANCAACFAPHSIQHVSSYRNPSSSIICRIL
jgi:hypothetical protein